MLTITEKIKLMLPKSVSDTGESLFPVTILEANYGLS
jgi:hypothetical protein